MPGMPSMIPGETHFAPRIAPCARGGLGYWPIPVFELPDPRRLGTTIRAQQGGPGSGPTSRRPTSRPVAATAAPRFDMRRPILYLDAGWKQNELDLIMKLLRTLSDDTLEMGARTTVSIGGQATALFPVIVKSKGKGSKTNGTEILRRLQDSTVLSDKTSRRKVIIRPAVGVSAGAAPLDGNGIVFYEFPTSNVGNQVALGISVNLFTRPTSVAPTSPKGTVVELCPQEIIVAHELVHAMHQVQNGGGLTGQASNDFYDEFGNAYQETQGSSEEFGTVGLGPFANDPLTENGVRREQGMNLRIAYTSPELPMNQQVSLANGYGVLINPPLPPPAPTPPTPPGMPKLDEWWPYYPVNWRYADVTLTGLKVLVGAWHFPDEWVVNFKINGKDGPEVRKSVIQGDTLAIGHTEKVLISDHKSIQIELHAGQDGDRDKIELLFDKRSTPKPFGEGTSTHKSAPNKLSRGPQFELELTITPK